MPKLFRQLRPYEEDAGVPFEVLDMAAAYEQIIRNYGVPLYEAFVAVKARIMEIKQHVDAQGLAHKIPCHNDALCENWVLDAYFDRPTTAAEHAWFQVNKLYLD